MRVFINSSKEMKRKNERYSYLYLRARLANFEFEIQLSKQTLCLYYDSQLSSDCFLVKVVVAAAFFPARRSALSLSVLLSQAHTGKMKEEEEEYGGHKWVSRRTYATAAGRLLSSSTNSSHSQNTQRWEKLIRLCTYAMPRPVNPLTTSRTSWLAHPPAPTRTTRPLAALATRSHLLLPRQQTHPRTHTCVQHTHRTRTHPYLAELSLDTSQTMPSTWSWLICPTHSP